MQDLIHLIYSSAARQAFSDEDLIELLTRARAKNARLGITGMLLYTDGSFFQVLEGPSEAVEQLFQEIAQDQRHSQAVIIIKEAIPKRTFGEWTMGFTNITAQDVGQIVGINDFFTQASCFGQLDHGRAKKLLSAFKDGRWRSKIKNSHLLTASAQAMATHMKPATSNDPKVSFAYQPIIDSTTRRIVSFEALVRGMNNESSAMILEQVSAEGRSRFDTNCRAIAIGMAARFGLHCNLNLHFLALNADDARTAVRATIDAAERHQIDPSRIVLEIDQDRLIGESTIVARALDEYRGAGLRISIDHFGAGRASLNLLELYRPEMLALNENMVRDIDSNGQRQAIVRGVAQTCLDLGIDIVAKHVQHIAEYQWLREEGVTLFQGDLFAPPGFECFPSVAYPPEAVA
jgi:EAL domain-containing protein (putative c-di-GMP-specific phosphodiesterase class I)